MEIYQEKQQDIRDEQIRDGLKSFHLYSTPQTGQLFRMVKWWTILMTLLAVVMSVYGYIFSHQIFFDELFSEQLYRFMEETSYCSWSNGEAYLTDQEYLDCYIHESRQRILNGSMPDGLPWESRGKFVALLDSLEGLGKDATVFNIAQMTGYFSVYKQVGDLLSYVSASEFFPTGDLSLLFGKFLVGLLLLYATGYLTLALMIVSFERFEDGVSSTLRVCGSAALFISSRMMD